MPRLNVPCKKSMNIIVKHVNLGGGGWDEILSDLLVISLFEGQSAKEAGFGTLDAALGGLIEQVIKTGDFKGEALKTRLLYTHDDAVATRRILLVGLGKQAEFTAAIARQAAGVAAQTLADLKLRRLASVVHGATNQDLTPARAAQAVVEGTLLGLYRFVTHKRAENAERPTVDADELILLAKSAEIVAELETGAQIGQILATNANLVRDLVNEPGNYVTPKVLAARAQALTAETAIQLAVYGEEAMRSMGMESFLSVSQGSAEEAQFIVLEYFPPNVRNSDTLVLLGKAITFDTGGISLKPNDGMWEMKSDMAGGAAVIGALRSIAQIELPVRVVGLVCAAENMPGPAAIKPGDVVKAMNGKSVEYISTDAEGRMVLADGLCYSARYQPAAIVDCATLTGSIVMTLSSDLSGVFCNDDPLFARLQTASEAAGEPIWRLPIWKPYRERINSDVADMKGSAGTRYAGAIIAALFLQEFVPENTPWAHLDIAGAAWQDDHKPYQPRGASANPMRTLVEFVRAWAAGTN